MITFLNVLFNTAVKYVLFLVILVAGVFIGKTLRIKKNAEQQD